MGRFPQPAGTRGSLRWIQHLVNNHPDVLNDSIGIGPIRWLSPRANDQYSEYRDASVLKLLEIKLPKRPLESFWPSRGPQWDALGRAQSGEVVLLEAKAHISEILSPASQASSTKSAQLIRKSLNETAQALRAMPGTDWSQRFYQYANRLAHAYLLRKRNGLPTRLVFLYLVGDGEMNGPESRREWEAALTVLHEALGIRGHLPNYVSEAFVDIRTSPPVVV
jgi:hypothetical protein